MTLGLCSYREQERHKQARARGQWQCGYCDKLFRTEQHLDTHMGNRHADKMPAEVGGQFRQSAQHLDAACRLRTPRFWS